MPRSEREKPDKDARLAFWLLAIFCVILWLAGGASRADAAGQVVARFFAWGAIIVYAIFGPTPSFKMEWQRAGPIAVIVGLCLALVAIQLVPLPPAIWTALPGRTLLSATAEAAGLPQPWRPISISPGATLNALGSLIVPVATLILAIRLTRDQLWHIAVLLLALIVAGCMIGLLQFSGAHFDNPLINDVTGSVSGNFANRNHFALFVSMGCILAPCWGFHGRKISRWKAILSLSLLPFFLMVILATGSRMGLIVGVLAIVFGLVIVRAGLKRELAQLPRKTAIAWIVGMIALLILAVLSTLLLGRAMSLDRAMNLGMGEELRTQVLPYIASATAHYFPVGAGFGTFDAAYRIVEPDALLQFSYLNHAHNDWIEVILDGGLPAAFLLGGTLWWWLRSGLTLRRMHGGQTLAWIGFSVFALILIASMTDYPARTPIIMTVATLAGVWLSRSIVDRPVPGTVRG